MKDFINVYFVKREGWYAKAYKYDPAMRAFVETHRRGPLKSKPTKTTLCRVQLAGKLNECDVFLQ